MNKHSWVGVTITLALLGGASFFGFLHYTPPRIAPENAPPDQFSAERAATHLRVITSEPHPVGSDGNRRVREYLVRSLNELGLEAQLQTAIGMTTLGGLTAAAVHNIMARKPGSRNSKAILLVAHYDGVPHSLGAGDDGAGVVAILETIRALNNRPQLVNDLIVLFTDGEEEGMLGAEAFTNHPWMAEVGLVLNFEGRGSTGPVFMFETGSDNGILIEELAKAAPKAVTNSLTYEVYKLLPNYTDFTVFNSMDDPPPGYNFSFIHGHSNYHTPLDNFKQVDLRSVQHHGSYMLSLVQHFGGQDIRNLKSPSRIYFTFPGLGLIHYSLTTGYFWAAFLVLLFAGLVYLVFQHNLATIKGLLFGLAAFMLILLVIPGLVFACWRALILIFPQYAQIQHGALYNSTYHLVGFCALAALLTLGIIHVFRNRTSGLEFVIATLFIWLFLSISTTSLLAGASFLFVWPSLAGTLAAVLSIGLREGLVRLVTVNILIGLAIALFGPIIWLLQVALTIQLVPVSIVLVVLLICLAYLPIGWIMEAKRLVVPTGLVLVLGFGFIGGALTSRFDSERKQLTQMLYAIDADRNEGGWLSYDLDPWTSQFLGSNPEKADLSALKLTGTPFYAKGNVDGFLVPEMEYLKDTLVDNSREVEILLHTAPEVRNLVLYLEDQSIFIAGLSINDVPVPAKAYGSKGLIRSGSGNFLRFFGIVNGITKLAFRLDGHKRIPIKLMALTPQLPDLGTELKPLPENLMHRRFSVYTLVIKAYDL